MMCRKNGKGILQTRLLATVMLLFAPLPALAGEDAQGHDKAQKNWMVGAGLHLGTYVYPDYPTATVVAPFGYPSYIYVPDTPSAISLSAERLLTEHLSVMLNIRGSYVSLKQNPEVSSLSSLLTGQLRTLGLYKTRAGGEIGPRYVFLKGDIVEVSISGVVGTYWKRDVYRLHYENPTMSSKSTSDAFGFGLSWGFVIQRELLDGLILRLSSPVLTGSFGTIVYDDETGSNNDSEVEFSGIALMFSPEISLFLAF